MFEPPRDLPQGVLIHFVSRVKKIRVQMEIPDQFDNCHVPYRAVLCNMMFRAGHVLTLLTKCIIIPQRWPLGG